MREPDLRGVGDWAAWLVHRPIATEPRKQGTVAEWLVFCPGAHAFWSYWWLSMIHLRPIDGAPDAVVTTPGAGWEIVSIAQSPDMQPDPDLDDTRWWLIPVEWEVQFGSVRTDAEAEQVAMAVVRAIMRGEVSPDSDFESFWKQVIPGTAMCISEGGHRPS
jgi:hypothetical protein